MNGLLLPVLLGALAFGATLRANEVVWRAEGVVTESGGPGFDPLVSLGDPVTMELRYNNEAQPEPLAIIDFPGLVTHLEFRVDLNLDLRVTVGGRTWQGTLGTGVSGLPRTVEIQDYKVGPETVDFFKVGLRENDGALFPVFPGATPGVGTEMSLRFESAESDDPAGAEPNYLGSPSLKCVSQGVSRIATATGVVTTGSEGGFKYVIDPATIRTEVLGVEILDLTSISYDAEFDEVTLTWKSVPGRDYTIQYLDEFLCWQDYIFTFAINETELSETFFPKFGAEFPRTQLYRVVELQP